MMVLKCDAQSRALRERMSHCTRAEVRVRVLRVGESGLKLKDLTCSSWREISLSLKREVLKNLLWLRLVIFKKLVCLCLSWWLVAGGWWLSHKWAVEHETTNPRTNLRNRLVRSFSRALQSGGGEGNLVWWVKIGEWSELILSFKDVDGSVYLLSSEWCQDLHRQAWRGYIQQ